MNNSQIEIYKKAISDIVDYFDFLHPTDPYKIFINDILKEIKDNENKI